MGQRAAGSDFDVVRDHRVEWRIGKKRVGQVTGRVLAGAGQLDRR